MRETDGDNMKKVLVIEGSPRRNGNSRRLAEAFCRGAREAGHAVETVALAGLTIGDCRGCDACRQGSDRCVLQDDMVPIARAMLEADVIALATPAYFYTWSALMKAVVDRTYAIEHQLVNTDFYLLATGAAADESYFGHLVEAFSLYVRCLRAGGNRVAGRVLAPRAKKAGAIEDEALAAAYRQGLSV